MVLNKGYVKIACKVLHAGKGSELLSQKNNNYILIKDYSKLDLTQNIQRVKRNENQKSKVNFINGRALRDKNLGVHSNQIRASSVGESYRRAFKTSYRKEPWDIKVKPTIYMANLGSSAQKALTSDKIGILNSQKYEHLGSAISNIGRKYGNFLDIYNNKSDYKRGLRSIVDYQFSPLSDVKGEDLFPIERYNLSIASKNSLAADSLVSQVKAMEKQHTKTISPILRDAKYNANFISNYVNQTDMNILKSPLATSSLLNRLNNLSNNYKLEPSTKGERLSLNIHDSDNNSLSFKSAISSFGAMELITTLSEDEVLDFYNHLAKYPMLGLSHNVGQKILKWISNAELDIVEPGTYHFRARARGQNQERPYTLPELWEAPFGKPGHGRYNFIGENVLYTSDSLEGALSEISENKGKDVIKLKLEQEIKVLNMAEGNYKLLKYCQFASSSDGQVKLEYLVPNFIAQCCRHSNIAGLKFANQNVSSINYALFDFAKDWFNDEEILSNY